MKVDCKLYVQTLAAIIKNCELWYFVWGFLFSEFLINLKDC